MKLRKPKLAPQPKQEQKPKAKAKPKAKPKPKPVAEYQDVLDSIDALCVRLSELQQTGTGRRYAIRHDVDVSLERALRFARMEAEHGIHSTYFLLHTAPYFKASAIPDAVREFMDLGHDVGLHHNALTLVAKKLTTNPRDDLSRALDILRKGGPIVGASAHGDSWCYRRKFRNYQLWAEFDPKKNESGDGGLKFQPIRLRDLGLEYEAYFLTHNHYLSDSGGSWGSWTEETPRPFERMRSRSTNTGRQVVPSFNEQDEGAIQVLVHPLHWDV